MLPGKEQPGRAALCALAVFALVSGCAKEPVPGKTAITTPAPAPAPVPAPEQARSEPPSISNQAPVEAPLAEEKPFVSDEHYSVLIRGGEVIDGTGAKRRRADVLLQGDRIAYVGLVDAAIKADTILDAQGAVITPGFIDTHAHGSPFGNVEYALAQGVTTIVVGQDGLSPARSIKGFLAKVDAERPRINIATLVGHSTLREMAALHVSRVPRPESLSLLRKLVEKALDEGAFGASTGLEYDVGKGATKEELLALSEPVGARNGVIMSHLRSEDDDRIEGSLDELFDSCKQAGARAHIAHFKIVLGKGEPRAEAILAKLEKTRKEGLSITADLYPYAASYTGISILFPEFARPPASYADAVKNRRLELLAALRAKIEKRNGPESTLFGTGEYTGKTLLDISKAENQPFEEILLKLGPSGAEAAYFVMDESIVSRLYRDPFVMIGTDGGGGGRHPRAYGAFARVLEHYVVEKKLVSLEEAIRKMTGLAAETLGLKGKRGCVAIGCAADILVFVPEEVHEKATFAAPHRLATGMRYVLVNGVMEREKEKPTKAKSGKALRFEGGQRR